MTEVIYDGGTPFSDFSTNEAGEIDYSLPLGKVRLLILDTAAAEVDWLFTDPQLDAYLELNAGSIKRTAAQAMLTIALSENLLSKKIRTQDVTTDGPAVAAELRAQAAFLIAQAVAEEALAAESFFEIVPFEDIYAEATESPWL